MKSIKLLAAFAIPAMFAACTNEEIAMESTQQLNQVVGAELIGTDISINVSNGVGSRLNAAGWQSTDKLGLAWIVNGEYSTPQDIENTPSSNKWYANHMFAVEDGKFVTKGNAYKGWHFAYFPFSYTESVSEKVFNINPAQTSKEWLGGRINDALHISSLKFLTRESLDENYQLKEDIKFVPQRAVNAIQVTTTATEGFAEGGALADLDVNSITLKVQSGFNVFADKVNMNVKNLPLDTAKVAISKDSLYKHLYVGANRVLTRNAPSNTITTDVSKAGFVTSGTNKLITITVPESAALDSTKISIEVAVDGGVFTIAYDKDAEEGSNAAINNAAIIALKKAYAAGGTMTKVGGLLRLNVVLYPEIFDTDFEHITDLEEWNAAVALATKLGRTSETFMVDSIIDFDGEIAMPEGCAVTVERATTLKSGVTAPTLNIKKSIESWPAGLTSKIAVVNHKTISNATGINGSSILNKGNMKAVADTIACPVVNEGTITLKALAKLNNVNNANGRINVAYGSYVTLTPSTEAGVIAYTIASSEKAYKLNNLMGVTTGQSYYANVNTFVVKSGRTLDLNLTDAAGVGSNDAYYPTTGAQATPLASLANINIELNEGILVADANSGLSVKNVEVVGGENNEIWNTTINEDLKITKGTVTVDAAMVGSYKESIMIKDSIINKANLITNADIYTKHISNPSGAQTTVNEGQTIWYTSTYTQGGLASGYITKLEDLPGVFTTVVAENEIPAFSAALDDKQRADALAAYVNSSDFKEGSTIQLPANTTIELTGNSGNDTYRKSFNLIGTEGTVVKSTHPTSPTTARGIKVQGTKANPIVVNIKNVTLESNEYCLYAKEYATINLQNVVCKSNKGVAILVDNSNCQESNTTVVNAYNVTIDNGDIIWLNALPCTSYPSVTKVSYVKFNYEGGNITDAAIKAQDITRSTGNNLFVNGVALPAYSAK